MADEKIQTLARRSASGDLDARKRYYIALIRTCEHNGETFLSMRGKSLWGQGERWCVDCGVCRSDPSLEPRPESAAENRRFAECSKKFEERMKNMTPAERAAFDADLQEKIEARLNSEEMKERLRPFRIRTGLTRWG